MVYVLADAPLAHLLHRRPRALSLPTGHAPIASGGSNSCRVGYLPPTGSTCPFHGARFLRARLHLAWLELLRGFPKWAADPQTSQSHTEGSCRSRQSQKLPAVIRAQKPGDSRMGVAQRCRLKEPYGDLLAQTKFKLLLARRGIVQHFQA